MKFKPMWQVEAIPRGVDAHVGAKLTQVTSSAMISHSIYCEERYCSLDGRRIAFLRSHTGESPEQLWIADLLTGETALVHASVRGYPTSSLFSDHLYYITYPQRILMRLNLATLALDQVFDLAKCPGWRWISSTVSPDDRWFVSNYRVRDEIYGLYRVDMSRGTWEPFHEHLDICNPHLQIEPANGRDLMVQLNHGGRHDPDGNVIELCGEQGASLYVIDIDGHNKRDLPIGKPHTPSITGHQCWVGRTGKIAMTLQRNEMHIIAPGDRASRCFWKGLMYFGHMSTSSDGKYFLTDNFGQSNKLYIGSFATGRMLAVLDSRASCGGPQYTHPHAYLTPDNKRIVYTADHPQLSQVWSAELPDELWSALDHPVH